MNKDSFNKLMALISIYTATGVALSILLLNSTKLVELRYSIGIILVVFSLSALFFMNRLSMHKEDIASRKKQWFFIVVSVFSAISFFYFSYMAFREHFVLSINYLYLFGSFCLGFIGMKGVIYHKDI